MAAVDGAAATRIEQALHQALSAGEGCPPRLEEAVRYAVFPGGARIRPRLALAVAHACGEDAAPLSDAAAAAIELLHCASLVHDDLPCFDDAALRRGRPSVHKVFGEALALLAGDALIVTAFDVLARAGRVHPERLCLLVGIVARSVGLPNGIVAGQAWECEPEVAVADYHRAKTGALFAGATMAGAAAAGHDPSEWRAFGEHLGLAYQVADDLRDAAATVEEVGKPVGCDARLGRPSAVAELGLECAVWRMRELVADAVDAIPRCRGTARLREEIARELAALLPESLSRRVA
jgi:geranylgeranyl diphosphate synthase type II